MNDRTKKLIVTGIMTVASFSVGVVGLLNYDETILLVIGFLGSGYFLGLFATEYDNKTISVQKAKQTQEEST